MMYRFNSTLCFAIFLFFITFSEQRPVYYISHNADWKPQPLYHQVPIGMSPYIRGMSLVSHKPKRNTFVYTSYNSGPLAIPFSHNLPGWPRQTYQGHLFNGLHFNSQPMINNLNTTNVRFLKPSSYSQYPPVISYPVHSHDYSTPSISRYTGTGGYSPYFRSTAGNPWTSDEFNPFQPSFISYDTKYSPQKPTTSPTIAREPSPRMLPTTIPNSIPDPLLHQPKHQSKNIEDDNHFKIIPATFGFTTLSELRKREMLEIPHIPSLNQPQLGIITEEYKPTPWNVRPIGQLVSVGGHRPIEDHYATSVPKSSEKNDTQVREDWYHTLVAFNKLIQDKDVPFSKKNEGAAGLDGDPKVGAIFNSLGNSFKNT